MESENDLIPLSGISNIKTIDCNENGYFSFIIVIAMDLITMTVFGMKKQLNIFDCDSFTQGACVNPEKFCRQFKCTF